MKVTIKDGYDRTKDICIDDNGKTLEFMFGGNQDLYWIIDNYDRNNPIKRESFIITKENYALYEAFLTMYNDIKNLNIYGKEKDIPPYIETEEQLKEYLETEKEYLERYKKHNMSHYQDLYNEDKKTITWYSDEVNMEVGNYVIIKKELDKFILEFRTQEQKKGYDREFNINGRVGIRFRNSGSRYNPFNIIFMRMYNKLQLIDDVQDINHQYHIEEYLYKLKTVKVALIGSGKSVMTTLMEKLNNDELNKDICNQTDGFTPTQEEIKKQLDNYSAILNSDVFKKATEKSKILSKK